MTFEAASPFTGPLALYALIAVVVLVGLLAILGRSGKVQLPFFSASVEAQKKVKVADALHVKESGKVGNITGARTKGPGPDSIEAVNDAVIEGEVGDITGQISD